MESNNFVLCVDNITQFLQIWKKKVETLALTISVLSDYTQSCPKSSKLTFKLPNNYESCLNSIGMRVQNGTLSVSLFQLFSTYV